MIHRVRGSRIWRSSVGSTTGRRSVKQYLALLVVLQGSWSPVLDHQCTLGHHRRLLQSSHRARSGQECLRGHPRRWSIVMEIELLPSGHHVGLGMIWSGCHIEVQSKRKRCTSCLGYARCELECLYGAI